MQCVLCEQISFTLVCRHCIDTFLSPTLYKHTLLDTTVFSFYKYDDIRMLLHTKHTPIGHSIFNILAQASFTKFAKSLPDTKHYHSLAIDDVANSGYSHTAILNHALKSAAITPLHNTLRAQNKVNYSNKTKKFRQQNQRNFTMRKLKNVQEVILVDDIMTTGTTLREAINFLQKRNITVAFCLTLACVKTNV